MWGLVHRVSVHLLLAVVVSTQVNTALVQAYLRYAQVSSVKKRPNVEAKETY